MDLPLLLPPCPHFVLHPAPALLPPLQRPQEAQTSWPHIVTGTLAFSTLSPRNVLGAWTRIYSVSPMVPHRCLEHNRSLIRVCWVELMFTTKVTSKNNTVVTSWASEFTHRLLRGVSETSPEPPHAKWQHVPTLRFWGRKGGSEGSAGAGPPCWKGFQGWLPSWCS